MTPIDDLAPDQRAVLQLLLKQGKAYTELATLLRISPDAVGERAVTALEALGPRDGAPLPAERRGEIADYLLGQQSASERQATREFLEGSAGGRGGGRGGGAGRGGRAAAAGRGVDARDPGRARRGRRGLRRAPGAPGAPRR